MSVSILSHGLCKYSITTIEGNTRIDKITNHVIRKINNKIPGIAAKRPEKSPPKKEGDAGAGVGAAICTLEY